MTFPIFTRDQAKARARDLRVQLAEDGHPISHSTALEYVAKEQSCADWNVLSARLPDAPTFSLHVGDKVQGEYLKQPFVGAILAIRKLSGGKAYDVTIELDEAVDAAASQWFSVLRRRLSARLSPIGVSFAKTSDGVPHMVIAAMGTPKKKVLAA
ncbi:MAG: glyoxalase superfamily protein [Pseudomonadota bacterium]